MPINYNFQKANYIRFQKIESKKFHEIRRTFPYESISIYAPIKRPAQTTRHNTNTHKHTHLHPNTRTSHDPLNSFSIQEKFSIWDYQVLFYLGFLDLKNNDLVLEFSIKK